MYLFGYFVPMETSYIIYFVFPTCLVAGISRYNVPTCLPVLFYGLSTKDHALIYPKTPKFVYKYHAYTNHFLKPFEPKKCCKNLSKNTSYPTFTMLQIVSSKKPSFLIFYATFKLIFHPISC